MVYVLTSTQFTKAGIAVAYTDTNGAAATQNITFEDKKFNLDSGLNVSVGDANFAGNAEVHGATKLDSTLDVTGASHLRSSVLVDGAAVMGSTLQVAAAANMGSTLAVAGAASMASTLAVTGAASMNNTLAVAGAASMASTMDVTGASRLRNTLIVDGVSKMNSSFEVVGAAKMDSTLQVVGAATMDSTLDVTGASRLHNTLLVDGATNLGAALDVTGASHLHNTLLVDGAAVMNSSFNVNGNAQMDAALDVVGAAHLENTLLVDGAATLGAALDVVGAAHLENTLLVDGAANLGSSLAVAGSATITGAVDMKSAAHLESTLLVDGAAAMGSSLTVTSAATMNGGLTVNGGSSMNGAIHVSGAGSIGGALSVTGNATLNSAANIKGAAYLENTLLVDGATTLGAALDVVGAAHLENTLLVDGAATLGSTLAVAGAASMASTMDVTGAAHLSNTLLVDGAANLGSTLAVTGAASMASTMDVTGASRLRNTLMVDGSATLKDSLAVLGAASVGSSLDVDGSTTLHSSLDVTLASHLHNTLLVDGAAHLENTLLVDGAATLGAALDVVGAAHLENTLLVDGAATLGSTLAVAGAASIASTLDVTAASHLHNALLVDGVATLGAALDVTGASHLRNTMLVDGAATLGSTLAVTGAASLNNTLAVSGAASLGNSLAVTGAATFQNNVTVNGNLTVLGTQTAIDTTSLQVKDAAILIADGNTADILASGIQMQYKPSGAADVKYAGVKRLPKTGEFVFFKDSAKTIDDPSLVEGTPFIVSPQKSGLSSNSWTQNGVTYTTSASSYHNGDYPAYGPFNNYYGQNVVYSWASESNYVVSSGAYTGSVSTTVLGGVGAVAGEWIQLQLSAPMAMDSYSFACGNTAHMPRQYYIVGSNDGSAWYPVQYGVMASNPFTTGFTTGGSAINVNQSGVQSVQGPEDWDSTGSGNFTTYPTTGTKYSYYRLIANAIYGASSNSGGLLELNEWYINFLSSTTATLPSSYHVEWKNLGGASFNNMTIDQSASNHLENINYKFMHRCQGYNLPAGTYNFSAVDTNHDNYWDPFLLINEYGATVVSISGGNAVAPWSSQGPYTGTFTLTKPSMIYAKKTSNQYYAYATGATVDFTRTGAASASPSVFPIIYANSGANAKTISGDPNGQPWAFGGGQYDGAANLQAAIAHVKSVAPNAIAALWSGSPTSGPGRINWYVSTNNGQLQIVDGAGWVAIQFAAGVPGEVIPAPAPTDIYATVVADGFNCASDARLKKNVVELNGALDKIDAIRGVHYNWIDEKYPQELQVGVIAQEIQSVYPELVREGGNGFLSVDYPKLTAVLIQSVKELKAMVVALVNKQ